MDEVWSHRDEPGFYTSLDRSVYSNVEAIFETLHDRRTVDDPPPTAALDFADATAQVGIPAIELGSPASHDAAAFAASGVPMGMIFVRNQHGSHNPREAMSLDDFLAGTTLLTNWLAQTLC